MYDSFLWAKFPFYCIYCGVPLQLNFSVKTWKISVLHCLTLPFRTCSSASLTLRFGMFFCELSGKFSSCIWNTARKVRKLCTELERLLGGSEECQGRPRTSTLGRLWTYTLRSIHVIIEPSKLPRWGKQFCIIPPFLIICLAFLTFSVKEINSTIMQML